MYVQADCHFIYGESKVAVSLFGQAVAATVSPLAKCRNMHIAEIFKQYGHFF